MSIIFAALVSFFSIVLLATHLEPRTMRRIAGYCGWVDLVLHITVLWFFMGTSTLGLLQAEACAILFSLGLRAYRYFKGYERLTSSGWQRYAGAWT